MITVNGDWFALETANTGYYLGVRGGLVENLHYGARVRVENSVPLREKTDIGYGGDVVYRAESAPLSLEHLCLELSPLQKGDYRAQSLSLVMPGGARTADFSFVCARRLEGSVPPEGMPAARGGAETLALDFSTPEGRGCHVVLYRVPGLRRHHAAPLYKKRRRRACHAGKGAQLSAGPARLRLCALHISGRVGAGAPRSVRSAYARSACVRQHHRCVVGILQPVFHAVRAGRDGIQRRRIWLQPCLFREPYGLCGGEPLGENARGRGHSARRLCMDAGAR